MTNTTQWTPVGSDEYLGEWLLLSHDNLRKTKTNVRTSVNEFNPAAHAQINFQCGPYRVGLVLPQGYRICRCTETPETVAA